ncbi:hypothetical protein AD006_29525 (plasmid) [Pseudonocardia sp. EC080610-09]|uniref:integration host factor, actinobacterial type n=1 Tax=unclassified Pseudonocardia TaxID=2619320 RepID=UPI000705E169|nr:MULTISPECIES: integration host factor, actinobacterial type [unclassified Pseudonocardia]ALL79411.1 hypothetical protein AD006_29525 [Pseudonocardia sp. EC080610-09]
MVVPHLTAHERAAALDKALAARRVRAQVKARLQCAEISIEEVLQQSETSDALKQMKVSDLIEALPNFGAGRTQALMARLGIAPNRRIRGLGERQRTALSIEYPKV